MLAFLLSMLRDFDWGPGGAAEGEREGEGVSLAVFGSSGHRVGAPGIRDKLADSLAAVCRCVCGGVCVGECEWGSVWRGVCVGE